MFISISMEVISISTKERKKSLVDRLRNPFNEGSLFGAVVPATGALIGYLFGGAEGAAVGAGVLGITVAAEAIYNKYRENSIGATGLGITVAAEAIYNKYRENSIRAAGAAGIGAAAGAGAAGIGAAVGAVGLEAAAGLVVVAGAVGIGAGAGAGAGAVAAGIGAAAGIGVGVGVGAVGIGEAAGIVAAVGVAGVGAVAAGIGATKEAKDTKDGSQLNTKGYFGCQLITNLLTTTAIGIDSYLRTEGQDGIFYDSLPFFYALPGTTQMYFYNRFFKRNQIEQNG